MVELCQGPGVGAAGAARSYGAGGVKLGRGQGRSYVGATGLGVVD